MNIKQRLFIFMQYILPHHTLSRLIGRFAECETPWFKNRLIAWFIKRYQVDMSEALLEDPSAYLDGSEKAVVSPADGAISQIGSIEHGRIFQAKGQSFSLQELLGGDSERAAPFMGGSFSTVYLSPKDYHRVHMPLTGILREMVYIPGRLFSVNQTTTEHVPEVFARNERVACIFDTEQGPMAVVLVGAMVVASIETVWAGLITPPLRALRSYDYSQAARQPITLEKGAELGRFKLGSTAIVLFGANHVTWNTELQAESAVKVGQRLAVEIAAT